MIDLSVYAKTLEGKPVAVFGLGKSGMASIAALKNAGVRVLAGDDKADYDGERLTNENIKDCAALILAPGVPLYFPEPHPIVKAARAAGVEIIGDIELLYRAGLGRKIVAITGTNGKSTTTALTAHVLAECGLDVAVGGNIGMPVLGLEAPPEGGVFVLEVSSYQIDLCRDFAPDIGLLLNITPDHIDRHGSFEAYKACKMRMIEASDIAIMEGNNQQAARQVAEIFGFSDEAISGALASFKNLPHRLEYVRRIGHVSYINDSKATNGEATKYALGNFDNVYLIAGGLAKDGGLEGLQDLLGKVAHVFLIGEAAEDFAAWLTAQGMDYSQCGTLDKAVQAAHDMAQDAVAQSGQEAFVLLSPACASFDQYQSFEHRGDAFRALVKALDGGEGAGA